MLNLLGLVRVKVGAVVQLASPQPQTVVFRGAEIGNGTVKTVGSARLVSGLVETLFRNLSVEANLLFIPLPLVLKILLAIFLLLAYVVYVVRTIRTGGSETEGEPPSNLTLWPFRSAAPTWAVASQVIGAVAIMAFGAHIFVDAVSHISIAVGIPAGLIALVLAPLATELPEKFNSINWLRDNKDTLALGNITGAMVFQSTIPVSVGILFTPWELGFLGALSAVFALISGVVFIGFLLRKAPLRGFYLLGAGTLYAAFLVAAVVVVVGS